MALLPTGCCSECCRPCPTHLAVAALAAAAAHQARRLNEQHLDNVLLAIAHLPQHVPEEPDAPQQLRRCVDLADISALRQELVRRLTTVERRIAGYTPTCEAICRALWALAALQVGGDL